MQEIAALAASSPDPSRPGRKLKRPLPGDSQQTSSGSQPPTPQSGLTGNLGGATSSPSPSGRVGSSSRSKGDRDTRKLQMEDPAFQPPAASAEATEPGAALKPPKGPPRGLRAPVYRTMHDLDMSSDGTALVMSVAVSGPSGRTPPKFSLAENRRNSTQQSDPGSNAIMEAGIQDRGPDTTWTSSPSQRPLVHTSPSALPLQPTRLPNASLSQPPSAGGASVDEGGAGPQPPMMMFGRSCPAAAIPRASAEPTPAQTVAEVGICERTPSVYARRRPRRPR